MQTLTLSVFFFSVLLALTIRKENKKSAVFFSFLLFLALILLAAFRDGSSMPDYKVYVDKYGWEITGFGSDFEPSFKYICKISNYIDAQNPYIMFLIYAVLGVSIKFYSIKKIAPFFLCSIVVYISNFYILHELVQIRIGVASAILLGAIIPLYQRNILRFLILVLLASFFHYSSFAVLVLLLFNPESFSKYKWLLLILIGYILSIVGPSLLDFVVQFFSTFPLFGKLVTYADMTRRTDLELNPFGLYALTRLVICVFFIFIYDRIVNYSKYFTLLLKMYIFGFFIYVTFASYPDIGYRISMLFMITEIFLIPMLIYLFQQRTLGRLAVVAFSMLTIWLNVYFASYFSYQ